jgi:homoserine O-succinyltransferase
VPARVVADASEGVDSEPNRTVALVNNMPDGAFAATERQFVDLLDEASGSESISVRLYTMGGVPRGEKVSEAVAERYQSMTLLFANAPDALIITGSNPIEPEIRDEPYWDELVRTITWGTENVGAMLLSCLAAHAALAALEGVERVRRPFKCTGIFTQFVDPTHPLSSGIAPEILLPHSRNNEAPTEAVRAAGYEIPIKSHDLGWSVATRRVGRSEVVLVQGHPEYDPTSLLREYHRDASRYVSRERDDLPILPLRCVGDSDWKSLEDLHRRIIGGERELTVLESYPFDTVGTRAPWPWRESAVRFYANWLAQSRTSEDPHHAR